MLKQDFLWIVHQHDSTSFEKAAGVAAGCGIFVPLLCHTSWTRRMAVAVAEPRVTSSVRKERQQSWRRWGSSSPVHHVVFPEKGLECPPHSLPLQQVHEFWQLCKKVVPWITSGCIVFELPASPMNVVVVPRPELRWQPARVTLCQRHLFVRKGTRPVSRRGESKLTGGSHPE